jgi:diguanylate cyclase (GGDEF)-like protein
MACAPALYRDARFAEYRPFAIAVGIAAIALALGLWLRDLTGDPEGAARTLALRLVMAGGIAIYVVGLWLPVRRALRFVAGCVAILVIEFSVLAIWSRLAGGYAAGLPGYLYIYMVVPLVMLPFSFRETAGVLLLIGAIPNLQVLLGMAPGFPSLAFNALVWPACALALFAQHEFDRLFRRVFESQRELAEMARRDPLTGLGNRREFMERGAAACDTARRYKRELCVLMIDVDHFKAVNDRHGHAAGDDVLRHLAVTLQLALRGTDVCARMGGEEFAVLLPETGMEAGREVAERIRRAVAAARVPSEHAPVPLQVTVSIGVAPFSAQRPLEAILARADRELYGAKRAGRNRVHGGRGPAARAERPCTPDDSSAALAA